MKNKIALITGGANGIGFEYARELLRNGVKGVALLDLSNSNGEVAVAKLESEFGKNRTIFLVCDVTKVEQLEASFKKVVQTFNGLDIVINNAGILDDTRYELMIDVNYTALVRSTLLALDYMGKHKGGKGGTVVNVSSIAGLCFSSDIPIYYGTKHAVIGFTQSLKDHYGKTGVRLLTICPGATLTPLLTGISNKFLDLVDREKTAKVLLDDPNVQSPKHVAQALIQLIQKGENGAIWLSMDNQPPRVVHIPDYNALPIVPT